jgi:hypothetical protein
MENNQHKDFDQFFQNKLNNRTFDYQDDFWTEMESQLPEANSAAAPKGAPRKRLLLLLLLMISFLAVVGWFIYPPISNQLFITKGKAVLESELDSESEKSTENNNTSIDNKKVEETANINKNRNFIDENSENTNDSKSINNNIEKGEMPNSGINQNTDKNGFINDIDNQPSFKLNEKGAIINTTGSGNIITDGVNNGIKNRTSGTQPMAGNSESDNKSERKKNKVVINSNSILQNEIERELLFNTVLTKRFLLANTVTDNSNLIKPNCDGCPILPPAHQFKIGLIAGLNTSLGYQNVGDNKANPSLDPSIGFRVTYRHSMTSQWRTNIEAIYFSRSALNSQIGYDSVSYGFGSTVVSRSIDIEELHYISLPIYATYQYNKKHAFMGGLSFGYLLNAQSQTNGNITETTGNDANIYAEPATQEWGYTTAFNRFDIGATLGYDYEVQKGWKVGARLNYGLQDVTKNSIFNNNTFDNNISLRLVMTCDLFNL